MYAQAEDNFWQIEDSYIGASGRLAEAHGEKSLNADLLNRSLEIIRLYATLRMPQPLLAQEDIVKQLC